MPLRPGTRLGPYEIVASIGAGGMGEVYRARDLNLARDVAIKVLPTGVSWDEDRRRRFDDEARAVAALNHPNILAVYQMGSYEGAPYLVSELLEGETLRQQISRGRLGVRKAIDYGGQIARGLAAAHQKGVVHRDLKPENLFLTKDGHLKILDFGLAKMTHPHPGRAEEASTATLATEPGLVMGTVGYMSPEQVRALETGHRTDIFSFGAVLYEMLTGRRAFQKQTAAETMSAILNEEPQEVSQITPNLPPGLHRIVDRCLEKKVEQRFQSASDLAFALDALSTAPESIGPAKPSAKVSSWRIAAVWVLALAIVAGVLFWWLVPAAAPQVTGVAQLTHDPVSKWGLVGDGTRLYFSEGEDFRYQLMQVSQAGGETSSIATGVSSPLTLAIAPDASGLLLGTYVMPQTPIWWLPLPAGAPRALSDLKTNYSACFFPDGQHFVYADTKSIKEANRDGSDSRILAEVGGGSPRNLAISADGQRIRFDVWNMSLDSLTLWELDVPSGKTHQMLKGWEQDVGNGAWTPDGRYFVFNAGSRERTDLWALPEKADFFRSREAEPIRLTSGPLSYGIPVLSRNGERIFADGIAQRGELVRYDATSRQFLPFLGGISAYWIRFSRDGKWAVYTSYPDYALWRCRADGSDRLQLSYPPLLGGEGLDISPDGSRVAFSAKKPGHGFALYQVSMQGGMPRMLSENGLYPAWSPDGAALAFGQVSPTGEYETRKIDWRNGKEASFPGGHDTVPIFWSTPNKLVALGAKGRAVLVFDPQSEKWSDLGMGVCETPGASSDGVYVYCEGTEAPSHKIARIRLADGRRETVLEIKDLRRAMGIEGTGFGVAPDGSVLLTRDLGTDEIYALSVKWR